MGRKANQNPSLGKSLVKKNKPGWETSRGTTTDRHTKEDPTTGLKSVTEESSYDEFIATAALARKDFTAEKLNIKFVSLSAGAADSLNETDVTEDEKKLVVVPRRPKWTKEMSAEELDGAERDAFFLWRRSMAQLQEKEGITPFERNIEVWRQLWRVVEKSDIVIQIVDARNPLLYRCEDLEAYVREMGKQPVLLINKADFLTESQRKWWSEYFSSIQLPHAFYSAFVANARLTAKPILEEEEHDEEDETDEDDMEPDSESVDAPESQNQQVKAVVKENQKDNTVNAFSPFGIRVLNREELITFLRTFISKDKLKSTEAKGSGKEEDEEEDDESNDDEKSEAQQRKEVLLNVGLVGYPNVGKSSTINSLVATKKTSVSSTPGKTKHFQTLYLEDDILLCDCPGLVMPAFGGSKGAMLLGGILPIDQLTNYSPSVALLVQQIPRETLESKYGITLAREYNHEDFLAAYASIRGFMTARGLPDSSRAARIVLKDYVEGRLMYCHAPPTVSQSEFQPPPAKGTEYRIISDKSESQGHHTQSSESSNEPNLPTKATTLKKVNVERVLDNQFFSPAPQSAHIKGKQYIPSGMSTTSSTEVVDKPWRKHNNKNKREKLRRVYRHLDVE